MKRLAALALLALAVAGGAAAYVWRENQPREIRGSSTIEFDATDEPGAAPPPRDSAPMPARGIPPKRKKPGKPVLIEGWPTYGYDLRRSHVAPYRHRPPFRRIWTLRALHLLEFPPAAAYGRVYLAQQRGLFFVVNGVNGNIVWSKVFRRCLASSPTVANGIVYQGVMHGLPCPKGNRAARGYVIAMNALTGKVLWRFNAGVVESSPLLVGNTLYFGSWDHRLYAVNARTGKLRWAYRADDELNSAPAYANGTIYAGSDGGRLHAVWARTGRLRWRAESFSRFGRREYFYATPTVAYGRVFIGNTDGTVYAYGAGSGRLLWARSAGPYVYTAAAVWNRTVYVGSYDGRMYAFDAATGDTRWVHQSPSAIHGAPTIMNGLLYFSSCGTCGWQGQRDSLQGPRGTFALDARTGRRVWSFPDGQYSPIVADRKRVYLTGRTRLYGLELRQKPKPKKAKPARPKRQRPRS